MKKLFKIAFGAAGFALLLVIAVLAYNALRGQAGPTPGVNEAREKAPDFAMTDDEGGSVKLSDMAGKPVVLNFWASWCPPCKAEMPDFEKVYKELGGEVHFMMVNLTGASETKQAAAAFIQGQGFTFPVYYDDSQQGARAYGIRSIPTTVFIDRDGSIAATAQGMMSEAALRERIEGIR